MSARAERRWSAADIETVRRMLIDERKSLAEIGKAFGVRGNAIGYMLRRNGIERASDGGSDRGVWSGEVLRKVTALWLEGLSAAEIAKQFPVLSRSAITARMSRDGHLRPARAAATPQPKAGGTRPLRSRRNMPRRPTKPRLAVVPTIAATPRTLADLGHAMCKWPVSDPPSGQGYLMLFCAAAVADVGARYCAEHVARTISPRQQQATSTFQQTRKPQGRSAGGLARSWQ